MYEIVKIPYIYRYQRLSGYCNVRCDWTHQASNTTVHFG